jgi:catechol 2,3-dioxygenase-like lactoylglutathione lyase family enzyme
MHRDTGFASIAQVAIVCRDIEASAKRWAALLGVDVPKNFETKPGLETKMVFRGKPSDARCKLAFFNLSNCQIELIQPLGPGSSWQEGLDQNGESIHHIAFKVKKLEESVATCAELGMPVLHRGRYGGDNGTYVYLDSGDKLGAVVELLHNDNES